MRAVYGFEASHIWRNIGILWGFFAIYVILVFIGSSLMVRETSDSAQKIYKRGSRVTAVQPHTEDAEGVTGKRSQSDLASLPTFTFQDVRYTVQVAGQNKQLLVRVTVYIQRIELG